MGVTYGLGNVSCEAKDGVVAVGVFDGVHWGHRAVFEKLLAVAERAALTPAVLTFEQHPAELLSPTRAPDYINTLDQRIELIESAGVREIIVADFTPELANLPHQQFVETVLQHTLKAKHIVVGSNFRFGKGRRGDVRSLTAAAPKLGLDLTVVPAVIVGGGPVSSTRVRTLIGRGDVANASQLLGRRFALRGTVVMGQQLGRTLGFPTANIQTGAHQLLPAGGVYAVEATLDLTTYGGVCNIGARPTFGGGAESVEVHLAGFRDNIYGRMIDVVFFRRLRDEMVFESPEHLADQIREDLERARASPE